MEACLPYLYKQIELIKPKLILLLGRVAATALLKKNLSLAKFRGNVYEINGIKTMVTYHPAALLRNPHWKPATWEDVKQFRRLYDEILGNV
jgi:DNA polymerase